MKIRCEEKKVDKSRSLSPPPNAYVYEYISDGKLPFNLLAWWIFMTCIWSFCVKSVILNIRFPSLNTLARFSELELCILALNCVALQVDTFAVRTTRTKLSKIIQKPISNGLNIYQPTKLMWNSKTMHNEKIKKCLPNIHFIPNSAVGNSLREYLCNHHSNVAKLLEKLIINLGFFYEIPIAPIVKMFAFVIFALRHHIRHALRID